MVVFGRVGSDGVGVGSVWVDPEPTLIEGLKGTIQVVFALPVGEGNSSRTVLLKSRRLDPIQPIGRITVSGLGSDIASQVVPLEFVVSRSPGQYYGSARKT